jgi:glycosyltransferase involved in cell wall biosynthesis
LNSPDRSGEFFVFMADSKLRILHVMASHRWTGAAEPAARLAAGQVKAGHDVLFSLTGGSSFEKEATALGVTVTNRVPWVRSYWPHRITRDVRRLRELLADFKPHILHAHLTHDHIKAGVANGPIQAGKPLLVRTYHREVPPRADAFTRSLVEKRTAGAIAVSRNLSEQLATTFGLAPARVACVGGDIDADRFAPSDRGARLRAQWSIPADAPVVGLVSRLRESRGVPWMLDAAEEFLALVPNARLVICGRGNYKEAMVERLASHPCRDRIVYAGYVSGDDLLDAYNAFDVFLMLRPGNDGACRAALEAMASGKPVIGGDVGAIHDLLCDGEVGWLVKVEDRRGLADAVVAALENLPEARRRGANARAAILAHHTETALIDEVTAFYERLLAQFGG